MAVISQKRSKLWIAAAVVWLAWLASVLLMWIYYRWRVMPVQFLPLMSLLFVQVGAGLMLVVAALWRTIRGPRRVAAVGWLLVGITPLWLSAAHLSHGAWSLYVEHAALTVPVKMASTTVSALADMVVRYRHPQRSEGKHVILFHDSADPQDEQLAEIDRHIEHMGALLGRSLEGRIRWVRGPVFSHEGVPGWDLNGCAFVTLPSVEVDSLDRHEIAHAVIDRHCGPDVQPPLVLKEGWAESQAGYEPGLLATRVWRLRRRGHFLSLLELTGVRWYACGDWPVYFFGGPLVEYLLEKYGGPKFLELYTTCRRETFAEDCRRVLGVDLDTLDGQYWAFIEKRVRQFAPQRVNPLLDVRLADGVDREAWNEFARQYPTASAAVAKQLEHVSLEFRGGFEQNDARPRPIRLEIFRDGARRRLSIEAIDEQYTIVATPSQSFLVRRSDAGQPWALDLEFHHGNPFVDYCARRDTMEREAGEFVFGGPEDMFKRTFVDSCRRDNFQVTRFERLAGEAEPTVRLEFSHTSGQEPDRQYLEDSLTFLPERGWVVRDHERRYTGKDGSSRNLSRFEYDDPNVPPGVPTAAHWSIESPKTKIRRHVTLSESQFQPVSDDTFELATFGFSAADIPDSSRVPWYVKLPAIAAPVSLVGGLVLLAAARRTDLSDKSRGQSPPPVPRPDA